ncbi:MAG: hypothetical protein AMXMBFR83_23090 [Phycisphaerae bacterium]
MPVMPPAVKDGPAVRGSLPGPAPLADPWNFERHYSLRPARTPYVPAMTPGGRERETMDWDGKTNSEAAALKTGR